MALCSNGTLVHCHHLPTARREPQRLSKTRKAKPQVKTCMEGLIWGQWMLTHLLRALFGQYLAAGQRERAWLHTAPAAQCRSREVPGHPGCVSQHQHKLWGYSLGRSLPCSAPPSPLQYSHSISSPLTGGSTIPCKALQSTTTPLHFAVSRPALYSLMHLFMSVLRRPKYPSGQDGRQIPICRISFLSRRMKSLGEHLRHPLNSEHRSQPLAQP